MDIQTEAQKELCLHLAEYALKFQRFSLHDSHQYKNNPQIYGKNQYRFIAGLGAQKEVLAAEQPLTDLQSFFNENGDNWYFGHLNYELKNTIEPRLQSKHKDFIEFPILAFFIPKIVVTITEQTLTVWYTENTQSDAEQLIAFLNSKNELSTDYGLDRTDAKIDFSIPSRDSYLKNVSAINSHIQRGDIYELNYCIPFIAKNAILNPFALWKKLSAQSPAPLSCFYRMDDKWMMCASPERFIRKEGSKLISQPMKGTARRSQDPRIDATLKDELLHNEKEIAENVMIVDLVRNDLSRLAKRDSVKAEELFGIYTFPQVYQMISTVSAEIAADLKFSEIIKALFPMGSMTGAPKIRAMELIEEFESFKRGIFSGSAGYISPEGDFDFNVIIRSILYNESNSTVMIAAGSAITAKSDSTLEYEECLLKAKALLKILGEELPAHQPN